MRFLPTPLCTQVCVHVCMCVWVMGMHVHFGMCSFESYYDCIVVILRHSSNVQPAQLHATQFPPFWTNEWVQMQLVFGKQSLHILVCVAFNSLLAGKIDQSSIYDDNYCVHLALLSLSLCVPLPVQIYDMSKPPTFWATEWRDRQPSRLPAHRCQDKPLCTKITFI